MKTFYRHILQESWGLVRRHYFLWPLAILASFAGVTVAGSFQIFFDIASGNYSPSSFLVSNNDFITSSFVGWSLAFNQINWFTLQFADIPYLALFLLLMLLIFTLAVIFVSSEGGLIYALHELQIRKKVTYLTSFRRGLDVFWHLFGVYLAYRMVTLIATSLLIAPLLYLAFAVSGGSRLFFLIITYLGLIPAIIILNLVTRYSLMYIVIYNTTIKKAFVNGWLLFRVNWLISLETALLVIIAGAVLFTIFSTIALPLLMILITLFGSIVSFSSLALQLFVVVGIALLLLVVILFVAVFTAFQMSVWVGVFRRIATGEHRSKIHRLAHHVPWLHNKVL